MEEKKGEERRKDNSLSRATTCATLKQNPHGTWPRTQVEILVRIFGSHASKKKDVPVEGERVSFLLSFFVSSFLSLIVSFCVLLSFHFFFLDFS